MTRADIASLLACVPIWMRPFVWIQLMLLRRAQRRHGRELLIELCHVTGRIRVLRLGDAPRAPGLYHYAAPARPAWRRACDIAHAALVAALPARPRDSTFPAFGKPSCLYSAAPVAPDTS
tara:strand:- start:55 stop:414 length:360 start_codon:yes stop_codon:yes gene_type:complete